MSPLRILIVEDHEESRVALARLLRMSGHAPVPAATLTEARALLSRETFDALLIDLVLPDGSGLQLMQETRSRTHAPAIAMTGLGEEHLAQACVEAGFCDHVRKPVVFDDLLASMQKARSQSLAAGLQWYTAAGPRAG